MSCETMLLVSLIAVLNLLIGYTWGRRNGRREGRAEGLAEAPIVYREAANAQDECPVCGNCPAVEEAVQ